uniref:M-ectatotoxin-Eb2c n=1 Tax=Ectatomma brunneum TaxID=369127 RepID=LTX2C_ECTBR|nr:RecName: Full=M-ectatotoxin-Eb2c; Short=M-ECTX-Eb2c; AltName: Full=Ponericin-Q50 [Ectatomma brunneum]
FWGALFKTVAKVVAPFVPDIVKWVQEKV